MADQDNGGFWIPKVAYKSVPTNTFWGSVVRHFGYFVIRIGYSTAQVGINISGIGYHKEVYSPHDEIMKAIKKSRTIK
jgi:hypothetical protein